MTIGPTRAVNLGRKGYVLELQGRPISVSMSASIVSNTVAGYARQEVVECARIKGQAQATRDAMGIHWMREREISQAVPPVYSRYLAQFIPLPVQRQSRPTSAEAPA